MGGVGAEEVLLIHTYYPKINSVAGQGSADKRLYVHTRVHYASLFLYRAGSFGAAAKHHLLYCFDPVSSNLELLLTTVARRDGVGTKAVRRIQ